MGEMPHQRQLGYTPEAMQHLFEEMKRYVGFGEADLEALRRFKPHAEPHFASVVDQFYARILAHPRARSVLQDEAQVERLKRSLMDWLGGLLTGPYDPAYFALRGRIGRVHVRVGLPQAYMFTAMSVVRESLCAVAAQELRGRPDERETVERALHRILDLELAIMLETYREDYLLQLESSERRAATQRLAAIGEVAATLAHEIRNPLAAISGTLEILRHDLPADSSRRVVIKEALGRIRQLDERVRELLNFAKEVRLAAADVDVGDVMRSTVALMREEPFLKEVTVTVDAPPELGPHRMDRARVQEVLINLLSNAGRAMRGQGLIRMEARRLGDGALSIAVEDTGPGVPEARAEEIFRPFVTTWPDGTGLGLSISRKIAEAHGGRLSHEKPRAPGARFVLTLPQIRGRDDS